jgi:hypothetical protein
MCILNDFLTFYLHECLMELISLRYLYISFIEKDTKSQKEFLITSLDNGSWKLLKANLHIGRTDLEKRVMFFTNLL